VLAIILLFLIQFKLRGKITEFIADTEIYRSLFSSMTDKRRNFAVKMQGEDA